MLGDFYDIEKSTKQLAKGVWETLVKELLNASNEDTLYIKVANPLTTN